MHLIALTLEPQLGSLPPWAIYLVVWAFVFVESSLLVGFLLPGDSVIFAAGLIAGTTVAMAGGVLLARAFGLSAALQAAFSLKTATAPVAIADAPHVHADPTLVAGLVVVCALLGTMIGPKLLSLLRVRGEVARGTALGAIASGQGVAQSLTESDLTGAAASIAMVLAALVVTLLAPLVMRIFGG